MHETLLVNRDVFIIILEYITRHDIPKGFNELKSGGN